MYKSTLGKNLETVSEGKLGASEKLTPFVCVNSPVPSSPTAESTEFSYFIFNNPFFYYYYFSSRYRIPRILIQVLLPDRLIQPYITTSNR